LKLKWNELKYFFDEAREIETMGENVEKPSIIGQSRAAEALSLGLDIKKPGYNIYIAGPRGSGRTTFAREFAEKKAAMEPSPSDLLYVYNFKNPKCPQILQLPSGKGVVLSEQMNELLNRLTTELPKLFTNKDFELKKNEIVKIYQNKRDEIIMDISAEAKKHEFSVKTTNNGIYFMPIVNGEVLSDDEYNELTLEQRTLINKSSEVIQKNASEAMRRIRDFEKNTRKEVEDLEYTVALFTVGHHIGAIMEIFEHEPLVISYLKAVKEDILDNLTDFAVEEAEEEEPVNFLPWYGKKNLEDQFAKYKINLLTSHEPEGGAPVVVDFNPTYSNLIGEIEYDNEYGSMSTDFMKIKPGILHKANGGYLILQAQDVMANYHAWETLSRTLITGEIVTEPLREHATGVAVSGVKPEPIPINIKIIIVGNLWYYDMLCDFDDRFSKLFRIRADFDHEMQLNGKHTKELAEFIKFYAKNEDLPEFDTVAIGRLIEYAARLAERRDRLTTCFYKITEVMQEAAAYFGDTGKITVEYINKAIDKRKYRLNMYEEKLSEMIEEDSIMISTAGSKVGQINGLAVIDIGDYTFAKPTRITATTYMGKSGIVNMEKEARLSGRIHDKGIQTLIGYLGATYAQDFPLSLSCRIGFEQNYSGIDGDSASSAELYVILSSLSEIPIKQEIAVTGSINQFGDIQPIGGVTHKIEGFFDLCKKRGLTGGQSVIIPRQNIRDLVLNDDVISAVKANKFHIHAITHVDEGIALIMGKPPKTIHKKVLNKLKSYYDREKD